MRPRLLRARALLGGAAVGLACAGALAAPSCGDGGSAGDLVALRPILRADTASTHLLRPRGVVAVDDLIVVVEEGRRTLTWLDRAGRVRARRPLYVPGVEPAAREGAGLDAGGVLLRDDDGYWTLVPGLGPVRVPLDPAAPPILLGAGPGGEAAVPGAETATADLSDVRGMALSRGELLLAVNNRILRDSEGRLLVEAGNGEVGVPAISEDAESQPLSLGAQVGIAADGDGAFYFADAGSARIWRVGRTGSLRPLAGGGATLRPPSEPVLAYDIALELGSSVLAWDDATREVVALLGSTVYRFDPTAEGGPSAVAFGTGASLSRSLAIDGDGLLVTSLRGSVYRVTPTESVRLTEPAEGTPPLAWAGALSSVGASSLLIQDVGQRRLLVDIPGEGTFSIAAPLVPSAPLVHPFAGTPDAHMYAVRNSGLTDLDFSDFTVRAVAPRFGRFAVDGQRLTDVALPERTSVAMDDGGRLWILDGDGGVLVRAEPTTGVLTVVAGTVSGGVRPDVDRPAELANLNLSGARGLAVQGDLAVVLEDLEGGGTRVFALNAGAAPVEVAGVSVAPGTAAYLGGDGEAAYVPGARLLETGFARIEVALPAASALFLAVSDPVAPGVLGAAADGVLADVGIDGPAPDALARTDEGALVAGWEDGDELIAANPTSSPVEVLGVSLPGGGRAQVGTAPNGAAFLTADEGDALYSLSGRGAISAHRRAGNEVLGIAPDGAEELALFRGGLLAIGGRSLFGLAAEAGTPTFADLTLPPAPGGTLVEARERFDGALRLGNLDFGPNVVGMAAGEDGALAWADGPARSVFRATPRGGEPLTAETPVERVLTDGVAPDESRAAPLALRGADLYLGGPDGLWRVRDGEVLRLGDASGVTGLVRYGAGIVARTSRGLLYVSEDGEALEALTLLGADSADPTMSALGQSLSLRDDRLVLVVGGEVYELEGWPELP